MKRVFLFLVLVLGGILLIGCQKERRVKILGKPVLGSDAEPATLQEIAPLTTNALGARKELHQKGWKVIPSSEKSFRFAQKNTRIAARHAISAVLINKGKRWENYPKDLQDSIREVRTWGVDFEKSDQETRQILREKTWNLAREEVKLSKALLSKSKERLILGYVNYYERTEEDFQELKAIPGDAYADLKDDFSNIYSITSDIRDKNSIKLTNAWKGALSGGMEEVKKSYKESGTRDNSLYAVVDLLGGYTMAFGEIFLRPFGTVFMSTGEILLWDGMILPLSSSGFFLGRTLASTGMTVYYTGKVGVKTISPTVEAGFLSSLSILAASATVPTVIGGEGLRAFNQVTVVTASEGLRTSGTVGAVGYKSGEVVVGMAYDFSKDTALSATYGLSSGIVLGYTALTVIPTHILLAAPDSVFFLAWDGPRLVIARSRGNLKDWGDIQTGTVVDLEKAKKKGLVVEIITDDPKIIKDVLQSQDKDLEEIK